MASYQITHTNGTTLMSLGEGVVDTSLGIALVGQNYHNYGQMIANNFVRLLENFANDTQPLNPQPGQIWWNTKTKVLSFFDGNRFKPCSSSAVGSVAPINPLNGDQWWNTDTDQLMIYNGSEWAVVGPLYAKGTSFTGILPETVIDVNGASHVISTMRVDGQVVSVINKDTPFTLATPINGVSAVGTGMTFVGNAVMTGSSTNALALGGVPAASFIRSDQILATVSGGLQINGSSGIAIGSNNPLNINKDSQGNNLISSSISNVVLSAGATSLTVDRQNGTIRTTSTATLPTSITTKQYVDGKMAEAVSSAQLYADSKVSSLTGNAVISSFETVSSALGNDPQFATNVSAALNLKANANNAALTGSPTATTPATTDNSTRIATTAYVKNVTANLASVSSSMSVSNGTLSIAGNIVPTTDSVYNVGDPSYRFNRLYGTTMSALYADLAELYISDAPYSYGTVVVFGGKNEITVSDQYADSRVAGIISKNPAYLMNDQKTGIPVALSGKVPCKVVGNVTKGDILVNSEFSGVARALRTNADWVPGCVIGKSMEDNTDSGIREVMVAVGRF